ncbi:MAG TPA: winged helix DNA-binding domain-containing protein, partial [Propionibacteriaceae bacterium]|nr:winged helix DNA-binding domain-containing protein [Propionibacteriaceae bacterium]
MTRQEVLRRRLATQRLHVDRLSSAADVVRLLCCVQSQEYAHALWSLGMRTSDLAATEVQAEFDRGVFLRTHILRPTWHFVAAEDIRWILALTAPRVQKLNQGIYRQEGLEAATLERGAAQIVEELRGGRYRTRPELAHALAGRGLASQRLRLAYIVMNAELEGVICSGPMRGAQQTYALLDERAPHTSAAKTPDAAELAYRFLVGHGPASVQDLARWSSLTIGQCREAIDAVKDRLDCATVEGVDLWFDPEGPAAKPSSAALLLPLYDEVTLSYPTLNFPYASGHPHQPGQDLFIGCVIIAETNVGLWRRTFQGSKMIMEITLAAGRIASSRSLVEAAAAELAIFAGKELELTIT